MKRCLFTLRLPASLADSVLSSFTLSSLFLPILTGGAADGDEYRMDCRCGSQLVVRISETQEEESIVSECVSCSQAVLVRMPPPASQSSRRE